MTSAKVLGTAKLCLMLPKYCLIYDLPQYIYTDLTKRPYHGLFWSILPKFSYFIQDYICLVKVYLELQNTTHIKKKYEKFIFQNIKTNLAHGFQLNEKLLPR